MKNLNRELLVLCDREEEYTLLMTEFLEKYRNLPWCIHAYSDIEEALSAEKGVPVSMLVVAEDTYEEKLAALKPLRTVILNETGLMRWSQYVNIDKYQQAQEVLQGILNVYAEIADIPFSQMQCVSGKTCFVGLFSPVRRCMQTTLALTMGQMLAEKHRTLYLNFEHYVGISELAAQASARDLADLLYFLIADGEKFRLRMQTIVQHMGSLDYVPPMKAGQNLITVPAKEWLQLMQRLEELGDYDYVILDLSESMQGLFDILRQCKKVFMMTAEDRVAGGKIEAYEQLLALYRYEDILDKTKKCVFPKVNRLPEELEQYTRGETGEFVRGLIRELEEVS